jgi:hypothetical protein
MSNDDPIVEYIDGLDNDVAAYYYSDEEADPFLKQKENEKNTNKSNNDTNTYKTTPSTATTNINEDKISAAEKLAPRNNNSNTSAQEPEPGAIEDGELDEGELSDNDKGNSRFLSRSLLDLLLTRVLPYNDTTDTHSSYQPAIGSASDQFERARIDILGFLSDTSKTSNKAAVVTRLAEYFGEPRSDLLDLAVEHLDVGQLTALVLEATTIEQNGGMYTADGKRKRTFGGVFFYIMGQQVPKEAKKAIFGADQKLRKQAQLQRQRNQKFSNNNRGTHYRGRGNAHAHRDGGGVKRKRENDSDPKIVAKKQKVTL